ncbi:MAG: glycosyl hydrolase family 28-related protein, partial [Halocynthiibacter sp.]
MNIAITDGLVLMPPEFENGLDVWSSGDGTPGSDTYDGATNAAFVPADQDFGGCLELVKTDTVQMLRWMGDTPILPGTYLQIRARVKAVSGNLPNVRIAGWAGGAGGVNVTGLVETGPSVTLTTYGSVVEITAIVGTGARGGVDMPWGTQPIYGHFGIDLTGANGGIIRVDDIVIEDVTSVFQRKLMDWVDVLDFGAVGDGVADDQPAFEAADAAAGGRQVLVPEGTYYLADHVTFENAVRFVGTVTMPDDKRLALTKNYNLPAYIDAFGNELLAFRKAVQTLMNFSDHDSLDMGGRQITIDAPIDVHAAVGNKNTYNIRRVIRNGQFDVVASSTWDDVVAVSQATYSPSNNKEMTG